MFEFYFSRALNREDAFQCVEKIAKHMQYRSPKQRWVSLQIIFKAGGIVRPPPDYEERPKPRRMKTEDKG